jgi:hypothetical protein
MGMEQDWVIVGLKIDVVEKPFWASRIASLGALVV